MKKIILLFILSANFLFSFDVILNSTREKNINYAILHIFNNSPFSCKKKIINIKQYEYICSIDIQNNLKIKPKKTKFAIIAIKNKKDKTDIIIYPTYKVKVYKTSNPLYLTKKINNILDKKATHWIFVFYKNKIFEQQNKQQGINFPIYFYKNTMPSIGALDLNEIPVNYISNSKDIESYLSIKNDFDAKSYKFVISEINKTIKKYPHSIFMDDFLLYKIRAINKILNNNSDNIDQNNEDINYNNIINTGKKWIKSFPSNPNIPEVLYYIATAYQNIGQNANAQYFYDILITEHPNSKWTKLGIIFFANSLYSNNHKTKAIKLYKDVLYSAKNLNVASIAALKLANIYIKEKKYTLAKKYYKKIIDGNPIFLLQNLQKAYNLALKLKNHKFYHIATTLLKDILKKNQGSTNDIEEKTIKTLGDIYVQMNDYKNAKKYYTMYISKYKYGNYINQVKKSLDLLFFNNKETNSSKLIAYYNILIKKYPSGKIYQKASLLKAKVLIKEKQYQKAISLLKNFQPNNLNIKLKQKLFKQAIKDLIIQNLKQENCSNAVELLKEYNIKLNKNIKQLAKCYISTFDYKDALSLVNKQLQRKDISLKEKFFWLNKLANILEKTKNFKKLKQISKDIIFIGKTYNFKNYQKALYYQFEAEFGLKQYNKAIFTSSSIEKIFKNNFKNISVYNKMVQYAKNIDNDTMIIKYATKIIELQKYYKSYLLSPEIELTLVSSLEKTGNFDKGIRILKELLQRDNSNQHKARILYQLGDLYLQQGDKIKAKNIFKKCSAIKNEKGWSNLCKESLTLF